MQHYTVTTTDDWCLSLYRLLPLKLTQKTPVLLLHGFGANRHYWLHNLGPCLGNHLTERGFEVWILEFRGAQGSRHYNYERAFNNITVEDKIQLDLPPTIELILEETGAEQIDLIGHSLGGAIVYAYLSMISQEQVRRAVSVAASMRYSSPLSARLLRGMTTLPILRNWMPGRIPMQGFAHLGVKTNIVLPARDHFNIKNMDRQVLLHMMKYGAEDLSLNETLQVLNWGANGECFGLFSGMAELKDRLGGINVPLMLLGGAADHHVSPQALQEVYEMIGSPEKELVIIGKSQGAYLDYGHSDLLLGPRTPGEVFSHIDSWLER